MTRDENLRALSYEYMKPELPCEIMNFSLSKPAEDYLKGVLPDFVEGMSKQELVPSLSHSRGSRSKSPSEKSVETISGQPTEHDSAECDGNPTCRAALGFLVIPN